MTMDTSEKPWRRLMRELKRRKVARSCIVYVVLCWGALQVADIIFPALEMGESSASKMFLYAAVAGFPVVFALSWFYRISPEGLVRTTSFVERRLIDSLSPINERRQQSMSNYFRKDLGTDRKNMAGSSPRKPARCWTTSGSGACMTALNCSTPMKRLCGTPCRMKPLSSRPCRAGRRPID